MFFRKRKNNLECQSEFEKEKIKEINEYDRQMMKRFLEEQQDEPEIELSPEGRESLKRTIQQYIELNEKRDQ